jgi:predicted transcriptional regulator
MSLTDIAQLRAARSMVGITQAELADKSGVSLPTIKRLEIGSGQLGVRLDTLQKLQRALEAAGVEFIAENGGGAGVRLAKGKAKGRR